MRQLVEKHFSIVLLLSCLAGLVVPGLPQLPDETAVLILALLTFVSCYRLRDGGQVHWQHLLVFYALRYGLLPVILWWIAHQFTPEYAIGVFLLSLVPAGVASPAFASLYGGIVAPAFAMVVLSQLGAIALIPLQFAWMDGGTTIVPGHLFDTLMWCIALPMGVYALARRHRRSADFIYTQGKMFSILLVGFVIAFAVARQRDMILGNPWGMVAPVAITAACYVIYICAGWVLSLRFAREERITFAAVSGFNNAALCVSLALLHFPPAVVLFAVASEISWAFLPLMMKGFLRLTLR